MVGYDFDGLTHMMTAEHEAWLSSRRMCFHCEYISEPNADGTYDCPEHGQWTEKETEAAVGTEGGETCAVCDCSLLSHQLTPDMEHEFVAFAG